MTHITVRRAYLREVTLPALERGAAKASRRLDDIEISGPALVVTGRTEEEMFASVARSKQEIVFYASTPAYCRVLELHGWDGLHAERNQLSKQGRWREMAELVDDDMLHAFAVVAEPKHLGAGLQERYGDIFAGIGFYAPWGVNRQIWSGVMHDLRERR